MIELKEPIKKLLKDARFINMRIAHTECHMKDQQLIVNSYRDVKGVSYSYETRVKGGKSDPTAKRAQRIIDVVEPEIDKAVEELKRLYALRRLIDDMIEVLTVQERTVIELRYFKNLKWRDIAKRTHYSFSYGTRMNDRAIAKIEDFLLSSEVHYNIFKKNQLGVD